MEWAGALAHIQNIIEPGCYLWAHISSQRSKERRREYKCVILLDLSSDVLRSLGIFLVYAEASINETMLKVA